MNKTTPIEIAKVRKELFPSKAPPLLPLLLLYLQMGVIGYKTATNANLFEQGSLSENIQASYSQNRYKISSWSQWRKHHLEYPVNMSVPWFCKKHEAETYLVTKVYECNNLSLIIQRDSNSAVKFKWEMGPDAYDIGRIPNLLVFYDVFLWHWTCWSK